MSTGIVTVAGCLGSPTHHAFTEGFEDGLGDWEGDAAIGPEVETEEFEREVGISEREAAEGNRSLRITLRGQIDYGSSSVQAVL